MPVAFKNLKTAADSARAGTQITGTPAATFHGRLGSSGPWSLAEALYVDRPTGPPAFYEFTHATQDRSMSSPFLPGRVIE